MDARWRKPAVPPDRPPPPRRYGRSLRVRFRAHWRASDEDHGPGPRMGLPGRRTSLDVLHAVSPAARAVALHDHLCGTDRLHIVVVRAHRRDLAVLAGQAFPPAANPFTFAVRRMD